MDTENSHTIRHDGSHYVSSNLSGQKKRRPKGSASGVRGSNPDLLTASQVLSQLSTAPRAGATVGDVFCAVKPFVDERVMSKWWSGCEG